MGLAWNKSGKMEQLHWKCAIV